MNRNTLLLAGLVLLLLAGPLLWIAASVPVTSRRAATAPIPTRAADGATSHRPRGPRAAAVEAAPERVEAVEPAAPPTPDQAAPAPAPRVVLRIRLEGLDADVPPANTSVFVERTGEARPRTLQADGGTADHFDVDVSSLVEERGSAELSVTAERRGYLTATGTVSAWCPPEGHGATSCVVVLKLRVAGWVKGIVQDDRSQPVAGADVGAWVRLRDLWARVDVARTDDQGVFHLRLRPDEANLVVVTAPKMLPVSVQATGVARAETELTPFTLRQGLALSGSLRLADDSPMPDATVVAMPIWAETDLTLGRRRLAYRAGNVFDCPASAPSAEGLFRVEALVPGDYDLGVSARGFATDLLATVRRRVSPPLELIDLVLDPARVVVQVTSDGRPVPRLAVPIANVDGGAVVETDAKGLAAFFVKPRTDYTIEFQPKGFDKFMRSFASGAAGAETAVSVDLRRRVAWPKLVLQLAAEDAGVENPLESADVLLFLADAQPGGPPDRADTVVFDHGAGSIDGVLAGAYRAVVTPRGTGYRLPAVRRVTLRDGEWTRADLRFPHGGRIRVVVRDAAGAPAAAAWRVLAEQKDEQLAAGDAGSGVDPLLAPGRYRVVVTPPGGAPVTVPVAVAADATVDAPVTLVAPRKAE